jgi:hypothetical protein
MKYNHIITCNEVFGAIINGGPIHKPDTALESL